ncbi:MAG: NADH-quinone oxidoreductase subunit C [Actinobacteria bacterium]|nr:NADH-quinone oxidoreductase subunit C [Actinomycetota bacterium]
MYNPAQLFEKLNLQFNGLLKLSEDGQAIYAVRENVVRLLQVLKEEYKFTMLADITAVQYDDRFEMVYHVMDQENAGMVRVKVSLSGDSPSVSSITSLWKAADVQEREIYDLMGITFIGHKNLKRILCPDDFVGHPLRKDFKLDRPKRF